MCLTSPKFLFVVVFAFIRKRNVFEERGVLYVENYFVEKIFFKEHFVKLCVCVYVCVLVCVVWRRVWKMNVGVMLELGTKA